MGSRTFLEIRASQAIATDCTVKFTQTSSYFHEIISLHEDIIALL
ncbi:MAG: hypothetical protein AB4352_17050 [Hormoscilla sp.]